jgi:hypothetical protein
MPSIIAREGPAARSRAVSRQRGRRAAWLVVPGSGLCRLEPHRMPRAAVNGVELHYSLLGSHASPRLLVLHHGFQAGVETWAVFAQQVHSADLAVLLFDCRGAGRSGGAQDDTTAYTFDQVAADTLALVDHVYQQQGLGRTPKTGSRPGPRPDPHSAPQLERGTSSARAGGQWTWCHGGGVWAPSRPPKRSRWRFSVTNGTLNFRISTVKSHVDSRRSGAMMVADEGRDSALIRAWFNLRHKLATAPSRHH